MRQNLCSKKAIKERANFFSAMIYLFPSFFLLSIFMFYPLLKTLFLSFHLTNTLGKPIENIGFENYINMLSEDGFLQSLNVTFMFAFFTVVIGIALALFFALLANEGLKGSNFFGTFYTSTMGISVAAGATIWLFLFHPSMGALNNMLGLINIPPVKWLTGQASAFIAVTLTTIWMNIGFDFLVLSSGLKNIPEELYESSRLDGAGYFRQLFSITIPLLSPTLFFICVVSIINALQSFGQIDILTSGGPSKATNLIVYSIYKEAFINYRFGSASAQAIVLFLFVLLLTGLQFKVEKGMVHYK